MSQSCAAFRILSAFICACLLAGGAGFWVFAASDAPPEASGAPDHVSLGGSLAQYSAAVPGTHCETLEQLRGLLEDETVTHITLTGDIIVDTWWNTLEITRPIMVEMGDYAFIIENGSLSLHGSVRFEGNGNKQPLFQMNDGGLYTGSKVWITARADNATAVQFSSSSPLGGLLGDVAGDVLYIAADGADSTAVRADNIDNLWLLDISAKGPGGVGVVMEGVSTARYVWCKIDADTAAVTGGDIVELAACAVSPQVSNAEIIECASRWEIEFVPGSAYPYNLYRYGLWVFPGSELPLEDAMVMDMVAYQESRELIIRGPRVPMQWDYSPDDLNTPGTYTIGATPTLPIPEISIVNLEHGKRYDIPLHVVERDKQYLTYATISSFLGDAICLHLMQSLEEKPNYRLWYRAGNAEWKYFTDEDEAVSYYYNEDPASLVVFGMDLSVDYQFQLEVLDGPLQGKTNILELPGGMEFFFGGGGGDRDGGDRGGGGKLTPVTGDSDPNPAPKDAGSGKDRRTGGIEDIQTLAPASPALSEIGQAAGEDVEAGGSDSNASSPAYPIPSGSLTYSARELVNLMAVNPQRLVFLSGGIKAVIPTDALAEALGEGADFVIYMEQPEDDRFLIRMFTGGTELHELGGREFQVHVPYASGAGSILCTGETGGTVPAHMADGMAVCTLSRTGKYNLSEAAVVPSAAIFPAQEEVQPVQPEPAQPDSSGRWRWLLIPCAAGLATAVWQVSRRLGRRRRTGE